MFYSTFSFRYSTFFSPYSRFLSPYSIPLLRLLSCRLRFYSPPPPSTFISIPPWKIIDSFTSSGNKHFPYSQTAKCDVEPLELFNIQFLYVARDTYPFQRTKTISSALRHLATCAFVKHHAEQYGKKRKIHKSTMFKTEWHGAKPSATNPPTIPKKDRKTWKNPCMTTMSKPKCSGMLTIRNSQTIEAKKL